MQKKKSGKKRIGKGQSKKHGEFSGKEGRKRMNGMLCIELRIWTHFIDKEKIGCV